jgi:hypothetical protein
MPVRICCSNMIRAPERIHAPMSGNDGKENEEHLLILYLCHFHCFYPLLTGSDLTVKSYSFKHFILFVGNCHCQCRVTDVRCRGHTVQIY